MTPELNSLLANAGLTLFDHQAEAVVGMRDQAAPLRACLYYATGKGKSLTALAAVAQAGHSVAVVVAPPSTHSSWRQMASRLGVEVDCISHAKFRMKDTKVSRSVALIADEFHLFGGHSGKGWKKLDVLARHLQAPLVLASATPNYNDAERVYCIQHVLDPHSVKGGFLEFLYTHCTTEQNPFGMEPKVTGFQRFASAEEYLAALPHVYYLPDTLVWSIDDVEIPTRVDDAFELLGYDQRSGRMLASQIEETHKVIFNTLVEENGDLSPQALEILEREVGNAVTPTLVFANHSTVAKAIGQSVGKAKLRHGVITGSTSPKEKDHLLQEFREGRLPLLIGTASLATGTDGLDKVCDNLVIVDDTNDDALRRQLVGRIMPRGEDSDASKKRVSRILLT